MKNIYLISLALLLACQFLISCESSNKTLSSFSKRKYLKSSKSTKWKEEQKNIIYEQKKELIALNEDVNIEFSSTKETKNYNSLSLIEYEKKERLPEKKYIEVTEITIEKNALAKKKEDPDNKESKPNDNIAALSIMSLIVGAILFFNAAGSYTVNTSITAALFIGPGLLLLAALLGVLALKKINKNPNNHKGKGAAIISIVIGLIGAIIGIITLSKIVF